MSARTMLVRRARPDDVPAIFALIQELARYEKLQGPPPEAATRLRDDAFGPTPRLDLLVAELDGHVVAYAAIFETYSTFRARPVLYLEDIFVTASARRRGIARRMLARIAQEAVQRGCARVAWVVLDWNVDAQRFYETLGATREPSWWPFVLEGPALQQLASSAAFP